MTPILLRINPEHLEQIDKAAVRAGLSRSAFCRQALTDAIADQDSRSMLKAIHQAVIDKVHGDDGNAAVQALMQMGSSRQDADKKVSAIIAARGDLPAADLIREALKG